MAPLAGMPRMRTNMKPAVMTSEVRTVPAAQAQRERRMGRKKRMPERTMSVTPAAVPYLAKSMGALYGIATGVYAESCSASGPASKPLGAGLGTVGGTVNWKMG